MRAAVVKLFKGHCSSILGIPPELEEVRTRDDEKRAEKIGKNGTNDRNRSI